MFRIRKPINTEIHPDDIFLDSKNLPSFETDRLEGQLESALSKKSIVYLAAVFIFVGVVFVGRSFYLQVAHGQQFADRSAQNQLRETPLFAERGTITDRNGTALAWNEASGTRAYIDTPGFGHLLGFMGLPDTSASDTPQDERIGKAGAEKAFDDYLQGAVGRKIEEVNAKGAIISEHERIPASPGKTLTLSIDAGIQKTLYKAIEDFTGDRGFRAGAGAIMDIQTGELVALTSFPEFDPAAMTNGDRAAISAYQQDARQPFLNRAVAGLYTPGSIIKPYVAVGALEEGVITPEKQILSTGSISVPNPYDSSKSSVFKDWRAQGWVDMIHALAVSSDVYFYEVGGGFKDQKGIGISGIEKYARLFGFGTSTDFVLGGEGDGTIPTPEWKDKMFPGEPWRLGDTYNSAIGQYGFQVSVLQMVRAVAALANGGKLLTPVLDTQDIRPGVSLAIDPKNIAVVTEGMREGALTGTASVFAGLSIPVAAKTGTAELGITKQYVNSWSTGFFPYDHPRYAFTVVMEHGPRTNTVGASAAIKYVLEWLNLYDHKLIE